MMQTEMVLEEVKQFPLCVDDVVAEGRGIQCVFVKTI